MAADSSLPTLDIWPTTRASWLPYPHLSGLDTMLVSMCCLKPCPTTTNAQLHAPSDYMGLELIESLLHGKKAGEWKHTCCHRESRHGKSLYGMVALPPEREPATMLLAFNSVVKLDILVYQRISVKRQQP